MRYEGKIYRPPSEWQSYLLQVTIGCSHNACTFCGMFKDKKYRARPLPEILEDISLAKVQYGHIEQIFLCDGDAIAISTKDLLEILHHIKRTFPQVKMISTYAGPKSTLSKSMEELKLLRDAGLTRVYLGVESGDEQVLKDTCKGVNAVQMLEAGCNLVEAGMDLYAIILIGLAGHERSRENSQATANIVNRMKPKHLAAMTYMPVKGTKMYKDIEAGKFQILTEMECLEETKALIEGITLDNLHFTSNHASNYIPIEGTLKADKKKLVAIIDEILSGELKIQRARERGL